jgi:hypothetical protein
MTIEVYSDASYLSPNENRSVKKSASREGYSVFLNGCLIDWKSKRIVLTAQSAMEAEVIALNEAVNYVKWLKKLMDGMQIPYEKPIVYGDNVNAIGWIKTRGVTNRSKHFEVKLDAARDSYESGDFELQYVETNENVADIMTKPLGTVKHHRALEALRMIDFGGSVIRKSTDKSTNQALCVMRTGM